MSSTAPSRDPIPIRELTKHPLVAISADLSVGEALDMARTRGVHHLPVCRGSELQGMLCTCDLFEAPRSAWVRDLMRREVVQLSLDGTAEDAARLMRTHGVGSVLVTDGGVPFGIVTRGDLFEKAPEVSDSEGLLRCECCEAVRHLVQLPDGRTLCVECRDRASGRGPYDVGGPG